MGFIFSSTYVLKFDDPAFDGLVVKCRPVVLGELFEVAAIPSRGTLGESLERLAKLFEYFCGSLVEWNLETAEGEPVAHNWESFISSQPRQVCDVILSGWVRAQTMIDGPLLRPSGDGARSVEVSMPMEPLPASLPS